jgi:hypothetical protein
LEETGPLFKLTITSTDNTVNQLRQQIGSIQCLATIKAVVIVFAKEEDTDVGA